jgi:hypothetical protein
MKLLTEASRQIDQQMQSLDLPQELSREAVAEYKRITGWLAAPDSELARYKLDLYPQGSFRLGTPIRPIVHEDEFDIDLVCQLAIEKERVSQAELKALIGDRLKRDRVSRGELKERRRCWTLSFKRKFHLDVLPAIPDADHGDTGVLITDTTLVRWQHSNPLGYAQWFFSRMQALIQEERSILAKALQVDIEEVPEWAVRTPLQRSVQVLKRHRDIYFRSELDSRPVSIIITTLAGQAYANEPDLARALVQIIEGMGDYVEERSGQWWVSNPAHEKENFADKWNEKPARRDAFLRWRDRAYEDMGDLTNVASARDAQLLLEKSLLRPTTSAVTKTAMPSTLSESIPDVDSLSHRVAPPWPIAERYECSVAAQTFRPTGAGRWRFLGLPRVPKHSKFEFHATTNAPPPYEIWWQISNSGSEARQANDLRGGFDRGQGERGESRAEVAKYYGTHLAQAFVVKDGYLVAKSREVRVRIEKK